MPEEILLLAEEKMENSIESLRHQLGQIRTGRANPAVLKGITANYYGVPTPIEQMSSISVPEAQLIVIKPYDKSQLKEIEKAIQTSGIGLTPQSDGIVLRLVFPPLTQDRRKEFAKDCKTFSENCKVAIRNIRRDANDQLKKLEKDSVISEDELKMYSDEVQKITDKYTQLAEDEGKAKEKQIMEI